MWEPSSPLQLTTNLDLSHEFDIGLSTPLTLAIGAEARHETYEVDAGDSASRYEGGSASYPGFTLTDQGEHSRSNEAGYVDVAVTPIEHLQLDGAGRFEHYSDFGDATTGKLTARRYDFTPEVALRGTVKATAFARPRSPRSIIRRRTSARESRLRAVAAEFARREPDRRRRPGSPRSPVNYSLGLVLHPLPSVTATIDAYQISIKDRIVGSGNVFGAGDPTGANSPAVIAAIQANGNVVNPNNFFTGINVFNNGVDTRTRGVDFVLTRPDNFGGFGHVEWSLSGSYDSTVITKVLTPPAQIAPQALLNETALSFLSTASPNYRIIVGAFWEKAQWSLNIKELIYGQSSEEILGDNGNYYSVKSYAQPITNISLSYAPITHVKFTIGADNAGQHLPHSRSIRLSSGNVPSGQRWGGRLHLSVLRSLWHQRRLLLRPRDRDVLVTRDDWLARATSRADRPPARGSRNICQQKRRPSRVNPLAAAAIREP